jgi:hypothetical protein
MAVNGAIWKFPKLFKISLHPNSKFLFKMKPAVLETFSVDYTPSGRASFFGDPNEAQGENAPGTMVFRARFIETEFWHAGNRTDSNNPMTHSLMNHEAEPEKQPEPEQRPPMPSLLDIKAIGLGIIGVCISAQAGRPSFGFLGIPSKSAFVCFQVIVRSTQLRNNPWSQPFCFSYPHRDVSNDGH